MSTNPSAMAIEPHDKRVIVRWNGKVVVDTRAALALHEGSRPAVLYLPRSDADMSLLARSTSSSQCPLKGEAAYFSLKADGRTAPDAVWTYEAPKEAVAAIKDHLAFYPQRVDSIEELD